MSRSGGAGRSKAGKRQDPENVALRRSRKIDSEKKTGFWKWVPRQGDYTARKNAYKYIENEYKYIENA